MANYIPTFIGRALTGSADGMTFKDTEFGTTVGKTSEPSNPRTSDQQGARNRFTVVTKGWRMLNPAQRKAWNDYAKANRVTVPKTGREATLSGFNWYVKLGTVFLAANPSATAAPTTPPASEPSFPGNYSVTASAVEGGINFVVSASTPAGLKIELLTQKLVGASRSPGKAYNSQAYLVLTSPTLSAEVDATPGAYAAAWRWVVTATGQQGPLSTIPVTGSVTFAVQKGGAGKKAA